MFKINKLEMIKCWKCTSNAVLPAHIAMSEIKDRRQFILKLFPKKSVVMCDYYANWRKKSDSF